MKLRESTEQAKGWLETAIPQMIVHLGSRPAVDWNRVGAAMNTGWRYTEPLGADADEWLGALQTSAWFTLDGDAIHAAVSGTVPEHDALPPLPFKRMAYDAQLPEGGISTMARFSSDDKGGDWWLPLFSFNSGGGYEDMTMADEFVVPCMVVFEIEQGRLWDCILGVSPNDGSRYTLFGFHITPGGHTADYEALMLQWSAQYGQEKAESMLWFDKQLGTLVWSTAVTAAHLITASNVINRRILPVRQQRREWKRTRYGPVEPRIYRVDIVDAPEVTDGHSDRTYHVRWMVRGHYRHTPNGQYKHPLTGLPATYVGAFVKGPAGAPWKGRPKHIVGATA